MALPLEKENMGALAPAAGDYVSSRKRFILWGCLSSSIYSLTAGAFIAGFAKYLGAGDGMNGIIGILPAFAGIVQLLSPLVFERLNKRKPVIAMLALFYGLLLGMLTLIPYVSRNPAVRLVLLAAAYFTAHSAMSFITPAVGNWLVDLTPKAIRGRFFGRKESYGIALTTLLVLAAGKLLDACRAREAEYVGFLAVFSFAALLAAVNFLVISRIKEPPPGRSNMPIHIINIIKIPLKNKKFRKVILLNVLWNISMQLAAPYAAVYMVTGLKLDYAYIAMVGMIGSAAQFLCSRFWGRVADKYSWHLTTKIAVGMFAVCHFVWFLINKDTAYILVPLIQVLGGATWACATLTFFNVQFEHTDEAGKTVYLGFNAALGGVAGFLSTLTGSALLGIFSGFKAVAGGVSIGGIQLLFGISSGLLLACFIFTLFKFRSIEK